MPESIRRWWYRVDYELRQKPFNTLLWFLLCHTCLTLCIVMGALGIAMILGNQQYIDLLIIVVVIHAMAFVLQVRAYGWLYPHGEESPPRPRKDPPTPPLTFRRRQKGDDVA